MARSHESTAQDKKNLDPGSGSRSELDFCGSRRVSFFGVLEAVFLSGMLQAITVETRNQPRLVGWQARFFLYYNIFFSATPSTITSHLPVLLLSILRRGSHPRSHQATARAFNFVPVKTRLTVYSRSSTRTEL